MVQSYVKVRDGLLEKAFQDGMSLVKESKSRPVNGIRNGLCGYRRHEQSH